MHHGFALGSDTLAGFDAGAGFLVEGMGDRGGAASVAELQDLDLELSAFGANSQHVTDANVAGGFYRLSPGFNSSQFASVRGHASGFEEARGPKPFVETDTGHGTILARWSPLKRTRWVPPPFAKTGRKGGAASPQSLKAEKQKTPCDQHRAFQAWVFYCETVKLA